MEEGSGLLRLAPVSAALRLPAGSAGRPLRRAAAIVDSVHLDGNLPRTEVALEALATGEGVIVADLATGLPYRILVSPFARNPAWSLIHEIGHLIDLATIGLSGLLGAFEQPRVAEWREAVNASWSFRRLLDLRYAPDDPISLIVVARLVEYHEVWARSYAQFIAVRSGDRGLLKHLDWRRTRQVGRDYLPSQWDDADFGPIMGAIEVILRSRRWKT